jgi:hypothetical protein
VVPPETRDSIIPHGMPHDSSIELQDKTALGEEKGTLPTVQGLVWLVSAAARRMPQRRPRRGPEDSMGILSGLTSGVGELDRQLRRTHSLQRPCQMDDRVEALRIGTLSCC